ncbi:MAG: hypothetical protein K9M54_09730, partial [Kiritimatiellales bacterium]|nr:hypothetical protein [Kiritimatiellales bacterium]
MNGLWLILGAALLMLVSGIPACCGPRMSLATQRVASVLVVLGSLSGVVGLVLVFSSSAPCALSYAWTLPLGRVSVAVDALSAVFLIPVFIIPALCSVFGLGYWRQTEHPENGRGLGLFFGLMVGSMVMVVVARDWILLLLFWEIMATSAYFLTTLEHENPAYCRAGWIFMVAAHVGAGFLIALIALFRHLTGSFAFCVLDAGSLTSEVSTALFVLAILSFCLKAEAIPLVWLPDAHANAPSHVSAVMSGVLLKMGVYALLRVLTLLPATELWNGEVLLSIGALTGILGIAFALGQSDISRLLAYSSIENIGIITMGIGLALIGRVLHRDDFILLGLGGALLHVWNHSLFKPLLFMNAGTVIRATRTRCMDRLGGLAKSMPRTAGLFLMGSLAICGLPPFNGFIGEWILYLGFFRGVDASGGTVWPAAGLGAVALAVIGALALACFVKIGSTIFLGTPRHPVLVEPRDPSASMRWPMLLLAAGCVVLGVFPQLAFPLIQRAAAQWMEPAGAANASLASFAPFQWISGMAVVFIVLSAGCYLGLRRKIVRQAPSTVGTWGFGYAQPTPRMQYTATSFGEMLVALFGWVLWPRTKRPGIASHFPVK